MEKKQNTKMKCQNCFKNFKPDHGLQKYCSAYCRRKHWEDENREKLKERSRQYYQSNKNLHNQRVLNWKSRNKEKEKLYSHNSYIKHKFDRINYSILYRLAFPEEVKKTKSNWYRKNPDKVKAMKNKQFIKRDRAKESLRKIKERENLHDWYVRGRLKESFEKLGCVYTHIPQYLIDEKRLELKLKRLIHETQRKLNSL